MNYFKVMTQTLILVSVLLTGSACENFLDVNTNPNNPAEVPERLQLTALESNFSYNIIGNTAARILVHWTQQLAYNGVPSSIDNYDVNESTVNNLWQFWAYTSVMNNARELNMQATDNGNFAYAGISKIILAWSLNVVTDLWDEVPYTEAFDPSNPTPVYDSQESVYETINGLLDEAIADLAKDSPLSPGADDLLYQGDIGKWTRLAHTLKARVNLHLTNAPGKDAAAQAQIVLDALSNGFASNADDADFTYYNTTGEENPWYQWVIDGKWDTRNQLSAHYVGLLQSLNDPRLAIQARPAGAVDNNGLVAGFDPQGNPQYVGHPNGENGTGAATVSSIGSYYSAPDATLNWISYAEAVFMRAEATFIMDGPAAADPIYREAIRASMDKLGVDPADRDGYVANRPALDAANGLRDIMVQKYIANFLNLEVFNDWRRTGYPELTPVTNEVKTPSGTIPVRFPYPASELNNNKGSVDATGVPVGYGSLEIHVWWDSNP